MRVELKNFEHHPGQSEETECFNAQLHINGIFAATAHNNGRGEANEIWFANKELERQFNDFCEAQPPESYEGMELPMNADFYVSRLVDRELEKPKSQSRRRQSRRVRK